MSGTNNVLTFPDHSRCQELHKTIIQSQEIFSNLVYLLEHEADVSNHLQYFAHFKKELCRLRASTDLYTSHIRAQSAG